MAFEYQPRMQGKGKSRTSSTIGSSSCARVRIHSGAILWQAVYLSDATETGLTSLLLNSPRRSVYRQLGGLPETARMVVSEREPFVATPARPESRHV